MNKSKFRVITSTNESDIYRHFWPSMARNWSEWYGIDRVTCAFITHRPEDDPVVTDMRKYGEVVLYKPFDDEVSDSIQAKATRMYHATLHPDDFCVIGDIDMYILNRDETWLKWFSKVQDNKLLCVSSNVPYTGTDVGKFPMAFTTATGKIWNEIVNPKTLSYSNLFKDWYNLNIHDSKEKVNQPFSRFSDESLLRALISRWENYNSKISWQHPRVIGIERDDWHPGGFAERRIDRLNWQINNEQLNKGFYYDSQPVRPFNSKKVGAILKYLNIE